MTKAEAREFLLQVAARKEDIIRIQRESGDLFCFGVFDEREIHISQSRWPEFIAAMQPVITYDPSFSKKHTEARFTEELFGHKYRVFTLFEKGGKNNG